MNAMKEVLGPARGQYQPTADNERVVVLPAEMEDNKPESENVEEESVAEPEPEAEPIKLVEEGEEEMAVAERSNEYKVHNLLLFLSEINYPCLLLRLFFSHIYHYTKTVLEPWTKLFLVL